MLNDVSERILADSDAALRQGQTLLVFPEGTRTGPDGVIRLNRGAVSIGLRSASVITPVTVRIQDIVMSCVWAQTSILGTGWLKSRCQSPPGV